jgi:hypothetical protein
MSRYILCAIIHLFYELCTLEYIYADCFNGFAMGILGTLNKLYHSEYRYKVCIG